ncbi:hypothetical protein BJX96DRAFT_148942 [Aspergillus floccosus]
MEPLSACDLLHICQQKLYDHIFCSPDHDLRILVGHSNMMGKLMDSISYQDHYPPFDRSLTPSYGSTISHLEPRKGVGSKSDSDSESVPDEWEVSSTLDSEDTLSPIPARILTVRNPDPPNELDHDEGETPRDLRSVEVTALSESSAEHKDSTIIPSSTPRSESEMLSNTDAHTSFSAVFSKCQARTVSIQCDDSEHLKKKKALPGEERVWREGEVTVTVTDLHI